MTSFSSRLVLTLAVLALVSGCESSSPNRGTLAQKPVVSQTAPIPPASASSAMPPTPMMPPGAAKTKVAILLPLTGKNAPLGQAMLNAAQLAVFDSANSNFELMPRDTGGDETSVDMAARDAAASGAQLFIGPLFGAHVPLVRTIAQNNGLNILTLSTDTSLASSGVYVMGFDPDAQVERVIGFAASHGAKRFAAIIPDNAYGNLVERSFQSAVSNDGGQIIAIDRYNPMRHNSDVYVKELASKRDQIDALFLPEGGADLSLIAAQLASAGFDHQKTHMLGTGLWDTPDLGRATGFLVGGWYAASDPGARRNFVTNYVSTYGSEPPRLATLAYDATAMAAVLAKRGAKFDAVALTNPNGFAGLDGIFRLTPQGLVERGLAVNEVTPDGARAVDAAPSSFAKSAY